MNTQTAKAKLTNHRRINHYTRWQLEDAAQAFCDTWGYTFNALVKSPSYGAEIQAEGEEDCDWLDFVKCAQCGSYVAIFQDDGASATCECGNHFNGEEVDWS